LEEREIAICEDSEMCIELGEQVIGVALECRSRLRLY
jgi:hypothetical protein